MRLLKTLPIQYRGELHDVRLVNFSVAMNEVLPKVPANIKVKEIISVLNCDKELGNARLSKENE